MPKKLLWIWNLPRSDLIRQKYAPIWSYLTAPCNDTFKRQTKVMTKIFMSWICLAKVLIVLLEKLHFIFFVFLTCLKLICGNIELSNVPWVMAMIMMTSMTLVWSQRWTWCWQWWWWWWCWSLFNKVPRILRIVCFVLRHLQHPIGKPGDLSH